MKGEGAKKCLFCPRSGYKNCLRRGRGVKKIAKFCPRSCNMRVDEICRGNGSTYKEFKNLHKVKVNDSLFRCESILVSSGVQNTKGLLLSN